ncbi:hypothetical protein NFHSH190041_10070 [Shewanella sp. NFH-SH190041]|uniref:DUF1904 domain-containing protein n=1 Tax=Shewanella sp. NFH-SH190041 TaxID=2950245 RepID=UPI0021C3F841|nr:DUF1904 domain-containing protein [Shewanella sp. NFH-SH190041]BDM63555.1 hypothetical protein NFHSH190041_10070 [Shewanella sp. NFH-SH190041]
MPHFRFRAIDAQQVKQVSTPLVDALAELMNSPRAHFTIEHIPAQFFAEGEDFAAYPFVEVLYFDRGQDVQDEIARRVTQLVRDVMEKPEQDVAVIFTKLTPSDYYDNGRHYG